MIAARWAATAVLLLAAAMPAAVRRSEPEVEVTGGAVRGYEASPGAVFKGIPYAAPPIGALRWREPQPVLAWRGVRDATEYSAACVQNPIGTAVFIGPLAAHYGVAYPAPQWKLSEDCLYLNIWTPEWPMKESHAVMFWIHGGSNRIGSGNEPAYSGAELARHGVVVVTINYRLGPLGFFEHPALTRESPHHASGNYGLLDQIAALTWVRDNIAKFGGDPARVTIFGESAGAIDIGMLLCSPLSHGLFARAIMESGPVLGIGYAHPLRDGERFGERVAALALDGQTGGDVLARLRSIPAVQIRRFYSQAARQQPDPGFVLDGWLLRRTPQAVFASGGEQPVTILIGNNGREASAFRGGAAAERLAADQGPIKTLHICYGHLAPVAMVAYMIDTHTGRNAAADSWLNDALMTCPSAAMATLYAAGGQRAYVYQFLRSIPGRGEAGLGSFHSLELPYVFGAMHDSGWSWLPFQKLDDGLAAIIESYWTNFARTGDPNGAGLPHWKAFTAATADYLEFAGDGRAIPRQDLHPTFCSLDLAGLKQRLLDNQ
ncbi:MAG TPA: carboxylesterase family protein [Bryobacteraceae bacterium]|nr:carboxylesterase family protein [Bryobacteraceae bacterium]